MIIQKIISAQALVAKSNQAERSLYVGGAVRKSHLMQRLLFTLFAYSVCRSWVPTELLDPGEA